MLIRQNRIIAAIVFSLSLLPEAIAHGLEAHPGITAIPRSRFGAGSGGATSASTTGLAIAPTTFLQRRNETPEEVEIRRTATRQRAERARREGQPMKVIQMLEEALAKLEIDHKIASKRQERDALRKDGLQEQAEALDREIHGLKLELRR